MVPFVQNHAIDPFGIVGQVLDAQFRVDRLVGEGGFSAVYRGHHLGLEEPIAIKCLKLPPSLSPPLVDQFAKRFRDESRILYRLSQGNLNVVRSIAAGTWQASTGAVVPYMILEWLEGRSLANEFTIRRTVGQQGRSLAEVVKLFAPAADGLGHAHSLGVVHRDLNPGNLFLTTTPQGPRMKVLDFGVAKILDESTINIARTHTVGQIRIFAPAYGAPEQFDNDIGPVGAASDVYAFALILLEALRDRCVNDGQHLGDFAQKAIDPKRRPTPRMFGIDVSDEVEQVFARATKFDPRERWQSAGELWQALTIAATAASQQKHVQAAMETPPLAMPQGVRSTKTGVAPPPEGQAKPPGARMDKTLPIGAVMPNLPRPAAGAPPSRGPSAPRVSAAPPASAPRVPGAPPASAPRVPGAPPAARPAESVERASATQRFPGDVKSIEEVEELPTRIGRPEEPALEEPEDEVTRVRAPEPDILRGLADVDARGRPIDSRSTQLSRGNSPRPAAGAPAPGAPPPVTMDSSPPSGGTLMMAPGAVALPPGVPSPVQTQTEPPPQQPPMMPPPEPYRPPSGQSLAQTLPLAGPHPLGLSGQASSSGPLPAAGAAPQPQPLMHAQHMQPQFPPQHGMHVPQQQYHPQQHPHPMMQAPLHVPPVHPQGIGAGFAPPHGQGMAESVSMPPSVVGVPKKNNPVLLVTIGLGALALIGIGLAAIVFVSGKGGDKATPTASASAPSASIPIASAPPPTPSVVEPAPVAAAAEDAGAAAAIDEPVDAGSTTASATATATATAPPAPTDVTPSAPTPVPVPVPVPVAVKDAGPPPDPNAFSESVARSRLAQANGILVFCKKADGVTGPGTASVTFAPDGSVASVSMD
ncbi:MAG: serine/threonine protein kinase, partial [Labilithrix sp.]|nr:serine/threonine protein kinase [Labilithrix sp.]